MTASLTAFTLAAILIVILPGPDTLVTLRGLVRGGRREGALTALGILTGLAVWVLAAVLGLAALLHASEVAYDVLKIVGACYLVWLGLRSLNAARKGESSMPDVVAEVAAEPKSRTGGFVAGFLTDLFNPKIGVLFVSFLPGFVPDGYSVTWTTLLLGGIFIGLSAVYLAIFVAAAGTIGTWMKSPRIRRRVDALAGVALIGFGAQLATKG